MKKVIPLALAALVLAPSLVYAQQLGNLETLLRSIGRLVSLALPIVVAIALLVFFWGLVKFIFAGAEAKEESKSLMIWGLVALFVMVAVWGIVRFAANALNINPETNPQVVPTVPIP
jgi:amino acid permease